MSEKVYLSCNRNNKLSKRDVRIGDIATVWCKDNSTAKRISDVEFLQIEDVNKRRLVIDVSVVLGAIAVVCPNADVQVLGDSEFIICYEKKSPSKLSEILKVVLVSFIVLFGSGFAIMAYNNDVGVKDVFAQIYNILPGARQGVLELAYSFGAFAGIVVFYNHLGKFYLTKDPTPIEVEMRAYEKNLDDAIIRNNDRG